MESRAHTAAWILPASDSGPLPNGYKTTGQHRGGPLCCCKVRAVLLGQDPAGGGAVVVVVPAGRQAVGSGARRDQELQGEGELGVRPLYHRDSELESKSRTGKGDWKGEGIEKGKGGEGRYLELTP